MSHGSGEYHLMPQSAEEPAEPASPYSKRKTILQMVGSDMPDLEKMSSPRNQRGVQGPAFSPRDTRVKPTRDGKWHRIAGGTSPRSLKLETAETAVNVQSRRPSTERPMAVEGEGRRDSKEQRLSGAGDVTMATGADAALLGAQHLDTKALNHLDEIADDFGVSPQARSIGIVKEKKDRTIAKDNCLRRFIDSQVFQFTVAIVISVNAVVIGLETDLPDVEYWPMIENAFLTFFCTELFLKFCAIPWVELLCTWPECGWNLFDLFVVLCGILDLVQHLLASPGSDQGKFFGGDLGMLLRCARLLRILRIFRALRNVKQLYLICHGFLEATASTIWVAILCTVLLYVCAIGLTRTIGRPHEEDDEEVSEFRTEHFGCIASSMVSLFELMAEPNIEEMRPVMETAAMTMFFVAFAIVGSFCMMSLLTGVIAVNMMDKSGNRAAEVRFEEERRQQEFMEKIRKIFLKYDSDGNGEIDFSEFNHCKNLIAELFRGEGVLWEAADIEQIFDLVDYDNVGTIEIEEFIYGLNQLAKKVRPHQILELRSLLTRGINAFHEVMDSIEEGLTKIEVKLNIGEVSAKYRGLISEDLSGNTELKLLLGKLPSLVQQVQPQKQTNSHPQVQQLVSLEPLVQLLQHAMRGCGCEVLDHVSGKRYSGTYQIDSSVRLFTVVESLTYCNGVSGTGQKRARSWVFTGIFEVYRAEDAWPTNATAFLRKEDLERGSFLGLASHTHGCVDDPGSQQSPASAKTPFRTGLGPGGGFTRPGASFTSKVPCDSVFIILPSSSERDLLITCLKILRLYWESLGPAEYVGALNDKVRGSKGSS